MASEPPASPPPSQTPEPGPNASREEWRAWRRERWRQGGYWYGGGPWSWWGGGWYWGAALVVLGIYFLLSNLGLLWWLRGDVFWPIVLILFGVWLIVRRARWWP